MSAAEALKAARAANIRLATDGNDLVLDAATAPPDAVVELLKRHKAGVMALLNAATDGWSALDWLAFYDERAGIAEFDHGLTRGEAETHAFNCCIAEWLVHNPVNSPPGCCLGCGNGAYGDDPLLPFGTQSAGHAWLHERCWIAWRAARMGEAIKALASMGIL